MFCYPWTKFSNIAASDIEGLLQTRKKFVKRREAPAG